MATPVSVEQSFSLKAAPDKVWPFISDTDRMNRRVGLKGVQYTTIDEGHRTAARLRGQTRLGGFLTHYEEQPWEWTWTRGLSVHRDFEGGPIQWLEFAWTIQPEGEGTLLKVRIAALPRLGFMRPIVWLNLTQSAGGFAKLAEEIEAFVASGGGNPFSKPASPVDQTSLERGLSELKKRGVSDSITEKLKRLIIEASDADCVRLRPFEVADNWGEERRAVLVAFLHAVPAGLLEMRWSLVCPSCRTSAAEVPTLEDISPEGHCNQCDINFDAELDRAVEAGFKPVPSVRVVPPLLFCAAGPARTPHVLVQQNVRKSETKTLLGPPVPSRYTLFARGGARASLEIESDGPQEATVRMLDGKLEPADIFLGPWGTLHVVNASSEHRHVKIEKQEYASAAVTAHYLSTVAEFRSLFSKDLLKRGTPLKVSRVSLLFTDLTGSTQLYATVGDAAAFRFVDDHFDVLREAIARAGGTVVKTMGDAVMAAFVDDATAARAAIFCLESFDAWRKKTPQADGVELKVGLHGGPCYVVTANGTLDFFGQTVNVAARLQGLAGPGELVLGPEELKLLPADLREKLVVSEQFEARVKGVPEPVKVYRVHLKGSRPEMKVVV
jgi:adenylate cyclase